MHTDKNSNMTGFAPTIDDIRAAERLLDDEAERWELAASCYDINAMSNELRDAGFESMLAKCSAIAANDPERGLLHENGNGIENTLLDAFESGYEEMLNN